MNHEDPFLHLQADDDLFFLHPGGCGCSLCNPALLHHPDPFVREIDVDFSSSPVYLGGEDIQVR